MFTHTHTQNRMLMPTTMLAMRTLLVNTTYIAGACGAQMPDWVVTSPPCKSVSFVQSGLSICSTCAALKLSPAFFYPWADRAKWLAAHPPVECIFFTKAGIWSRRFDSRWLLASSGVFGTIRSWIHQRKGVGRERRRLNQHGTFSIVSTLAPIYSTYLDSTL